MLAKILRFAVDSLLYCCAPMNRRAFTLRPSVVIVIICYYVWLGMRCHVLEHERQYGLDVDALVISDRMHPNMIPIMVRTRTLL